jgi:hypothetical protein
MEAAVKPDEITVAGSIAASQSWSDGLALMDRTTQRFWWPISLGNVKSKMRNHLSKIKWGNTDYTVPLNFGQVVSHFEHPVNIGLSRRPHPRTIRFANHPV